MSRQKNISTRPANADDWFTPWRFAGVLALLMAVCFPLVLFGFETFYFRDFGAFTFSTVFFEKDSIWAGQIPLWNPYSECGIPFLAQWNTTTLYPPSIFYLVFPLSWSLGVFELGHFLLGGMGMYFLAHGWTKNRFAASVAGTVFAFNGLTWQALMWSSNLAALCWMPWVALATQQAWQSGGKKIILAALAGGMQMLSGAPEIIVLTWFLLAALWFSECRQNPAVRNKTLARFLLIVLLVVLLGAAQIFPFLDLLKNSQRNQDFNSDLWQMPLSGWANFLTPLFHAFQQKGVISQYAQFWTGSYYLGVATIALALWAFMLKPPKQIGMLASLTLFCLIMALGKQGAVYYVLKRIFPLVGLMRYPIKFVTLPVLCIPLLAAFGISQFLASTREQQPPAFKKLRGIGLGLLLIMGILCGVEWLWPLIQDDRSATVLNAAVRALFLIAILAGFAGLGRIQEFKLQVLARICLLFLFWFDVFTHEPNPNPTVNPAVYEPDTVRQFFNWDRALRPGQSRALETLPAMKKIYERGVKDPAADVNGRRLALFADYNLLDHAAKIDGFFSLELREMRRLTDELYSRTNDLPKLEDFMGVEKISNPTNAVDWVTRGTFLPLITAGQEPLFADDDTLKQLVVSPVFEPSQSVYLPLENRSEVSAHRTSAKISATTFAAQEITAQVDSDAPAMVVVAQAFYHDWHAYVDGKRVKLWRANYAFQALEVPAGTHQVRLIYEDAAFKWGSVISVATLASLGLCWLRMGKKII